MSDTFLSRRVRLQSSIGNFSRDFCRRSFILLPKASQLSSLERAQPTMRRNILRRTVSNLVVESTICIFVPPSLVAPRRESRSENSSILSHEEQRTDVSGFGSDTGAGSESGRYVTLRYVRSSTKIGLHRALTEKKAMYNGHTTQVIS